MDSGYKRQSLFDSCAEPPPALADPPSVRGGQRATAAGGLHPKKVDGYYVTTGDSWMTVVDTSSASSGHSRASPAARRGPLRPADGGGVTTALAAKALTEAKRLGVHRLLVALLSLVTAVTGIFCVLSISRVFYDNHLFKTWKSYQGGASKGPGSPTVAADSDGNIRMPAIPEQILGMEDALLNLGLPAIGVGVLGIFAARLLKYPLGMYAYIMASAAFSLACFWTVGTAATQRYITAGEQQLSTHLEVLWNGLVALPNRSGHHTLCEMQESFQCSGFSICCITNDTAIAEEELVTHDGGPGPAWDALCFLTLPNGTQIDRAGVRVDRQVRQQCSHSLRLPLPDDSGTTSSSASSSTAQPAVRVPLYSSESFHNNRRSISFLSSASISTPTNEMTQRLHETFFPKPEGNARENLQQRGAAELAIIPETQEEDPPLCPAPSHATAGFARSPPCQDAFLGALTTSLSFVMCAVFTMAVFSSVGLSFALVALKEGPRRAVLVSGERATEMVGMSLHTDVLFTPLETEQSPSISKGRGN